MAGQTQHSPVKTSNLLDKCTMTGTNLQAEAIDTEPIQA